MEKSPEELGSIFGIVVSQSEKLLQDISLLETDLKSIYEANTAMMQNSIDKELLIAYLDKLKLPATFLKAKDNVFEKLSSDLKSYEEQRVGLIKKSQVDIPSKNRKIFVLMEFLPRKINPLNEKYNSLLDLLNKDGKIDQIFRQLETINNSKRRRILKSLEWKKSLSLTIQLAEEVNLMITALINAYQTENELEFNQHMAAFDIKVKYLDKYLNIKQCISDVVLDTNASIVTEDEITEAYKKIYNTKKILDKLIVSISSQKHVDYLVNSLKDELIKISEEKKNISLQIMNIDKPLESIRLILQNKSYLLEVFWKLSMLEFEEFSQELKDILDVPGFNEWNDARKKYAVIFKIKQCGSAFNSVFKVLMESFDQALFNYRKAKRNYSRYQDASAKRGLDAATMHPIDVTSLANMCLGQFASICSNLNKSDLYLKNTNEFYKENLKLATELYTNLQAGLKEWGNIFKGMYR